MSDTRGRAPQEPHCQTCTDTGRNGSCARRRCYCGHEACWAFDSWIDLDSLALVTAPQREASKSRAAKAWDTKEDETWLEKF